MKVCGSSEGIICGKNGKAKIDLCNRHRRQVWEYGFVIDNESSTNNRVITYKDHAK